MIIKSDIIDWLISNDSLINDIKDDLNYRSIYNKDFKEEYKNQYNDELIKEIFHHISNDFGCSIEDIYDKLDKDELNKYLEII